uniref:NADH-ubiquinone oxidoreductase chain 4L n=1 Tax=Hylastes attenuatus TaxID=471226 RepID=A0A343A6J3_9CUCU|nr:NADH dehydrogenase subunit 4L [Hylastes attenuatus]AOY40185.1 NADH dehydrogenase subunit 4L [Hylastes attenuatus]
MYFYSFSLVGLFLSGVLVFLLNYSHFLLLLLSFEIMVISLYVLMFFYYNYYYSEQFVSVFYLTLSVCESALGLSLLVLMIRTHGSDMMVMFDMLW